jgi:hypothetical protein
MATFEYNPLADSVTVKYECPQCGHINEDTFWVPEPDMLAETHHDSINQDFDDAVCEECDAQFNVILTNGFYGGEGEIEDVEKILDVEESIPGEDEDYYDKQLYDATHTDIEKMLDSSSALPEDVKPKLFKLLYANAITMMETYLGDTLKREVLKDEAGIRCFVENYKDFQKRQISLSDLYNEREALPKLIRETLKTILYHDLPKIKPIYKAVLNIDLGDISDLYRAVLIRHHIVHRNGHDHDGKELEIKKEDVQQLQDRVKKLIELVDSELEARRDALMQAALKDAAQLNDFPFNL